MAMPMAERTANVSGELGVTLSAPTAERGSSRIVRGVLRLLASLDYRAVTEFPLPHGRRADVVAVDDHGLFAIVEVKSSVADFRSDGKWPEYRAYCDRLYFGVDPGFPLSLLPHDVGIIVADSFAGVVVRPPPETAMNATRRRALLLRFGRTAAGRLASLTDGPFAFDGGRFSTSPEPAQ